MIVVTLTHFGGWYHVLWTEDGREHSRSIGIRVGKYGGGASLRRAQRRRAAIESRLNAPERAEALERKREERQVYRLHRIYQRMRERGGV